MFPEKVGKTARNAPERHPVHSPDWFDKVLACAMMLTARGFAPALCTRAVNSLACSDEPSTR